jgi:hypothetical protein
LYATFSNFVSIVKTPQRSLAGGLSELDSKSIIM